MVDARRPRGLERLGQSKLLKQSLSCYTLCVSEALERTTEDPVRRVTKTLVTTSAWTLAALSLGAAARSGEPSAAVAEAPVLLQPSRGGFDSATPPRSKPSSSQSLEWVLSLPPECFELPGRPYCSGKKKFRTLEQTTEDPVRQVAKTLVTTSAWALAALSLGDAAQSGEPSAAVASAPVPLGLPRGGALE